MEPKVAGFLKRGVFICKHFLRNSEAWTVLGWFLVFLERCASLGDQSVRNKTSEQLQDVCDVMCLLPFFFGQNVRKSYR